MIGRFLDNIRECNCPFRGHWLNAFWVLLSLFGWLPKDLMNENWGYIVLDVFVIVVHGARILAARHNKPRGPKKKGALDRKWADLVASWRKPGIGTV